MRLVGWFLSRRRLLREVANARRAQRAAELFADATVIDNADLERRIRDLENADV